MPHLHHGALGSGGPVLLTGTLVILAFIYLRGWVSLRSERLIRIAAWRACSFLLGLFLIWAALASPFSSLDHELLTAHMLKHLLLMTVAPPLIWLGEPMRCVAWAFPIAIWRTRISALQQIGKALARPEVCWLAAAAALLLWHIPAIFALGMRSAEWHFVEQSSFLVSGLLFWWPVIQPWPSALRPELSMILYLFFATVPCDVLSGFLVFCDRVIYTGYLSSSRLFGLDALGDQQCAAALMWTCVTLVYLVAGTTLSMRLLSRQNSRDHEFAYADMYVIPAQRNVQHKLEAF
ncbi:MAG: cytochrome c oxidase assembly protein [Acidobacteriaceae bacterium]|nr:cytochrome c oxidase assembly protein [Acidobacteriaceae bacterium]